MFLICLISSLLIRSSTVLIVALSFTVAVTTMAGAGEVMQGPVVARLIRVIDGDSIEVEAKVWIGQRLRIQVRLEGIDAPELRGSCAAEQALAREAQAEVLRLLEGRDGEEPELLLYDIRNGKYAGRVLAQVRLAEEPDGERESVPDGGKGLDGDLGQHLLSRGLARPYAGGRKIAWCEELGHPRAAPQEAYFRPRRKPHFAGQPH